MSQIRPGPDVFPAQDAVYDCPDSLLEEAAEFTEAE